jgi:hypothetical protein
MAKSMPQPLVMTIQSALILLVLTDLWFAMTFSSAVETGSLDIMLESSLPWAVWDDMSFF